MDGGKLIMNWIKVLFVCCFASLLVFSGTGTTASASFIDATEIEAFMDKAIEEKMEEFHIPNATVSVVSDGKVILEKGYGYASLEDQEKTNGATTMFRLGSVSKLFTWTAVMQLVEQGKLDLDTDINEYLDFEIPSKLEVGGLVETEPITLHHLMTHTPGFEDYPDSILRISADEQLPLHEYVREHMPARVFPPGEVTAYSNYGTALAGYIVEGVSGIPFSEYVEKNIYQPLAMNQSTFRQPLPEELSPNLAQAYRFVDGEYRKGDFEFLPEPAGSMSSTAGDMAEFMTAYLEGGKNEAGRILEEKTVQQMFRQQFTQHPALDGMTLGFMEKTINGERVLSHGGNTMLFDAGMYLLPDENIGLFISYSGGNFLIHTEIIQEFMDHYFPSDVTATPLPPEGAFDRSKKFVGEYHQNRKSFTTSESILSLVSGVIRVDVNESGDLLVNHIGVTNKFTETEHGIYQNTREGTTPDAYGEFRTIVFKTDPFGNIMLTVDGPMTYSKVPSYATSGLTFLSIMMALLLFTGSLIYWGIASIVRIFKRKKTQQRKGALAARWVAIVYGLFFLGMVAGIVLINEIDPVYGLPKSAYSTLPSWVSIVDLFPYVLVLSGVALLFYTVLAWWKKYWGIPGRIHYTLLTMAALNVMWIFWYWNII